MKVIFTLISFLLLANGQGQDPIVLSYPEYIELVKKHHPVMYQSELLGQMANSTQKIARGGFDPKIEGDWTHKSFDDKNYYSLLNTAVKIPTWFGIDLKAGYNRNNGQFLNESDFIPQRGLWNAGISVPLGKGLIIDKRRAQLKKADVYQSITTQEQKLMINEILYQSSIAYLKWQTAAERLSIAEEGVQIAQERLRGTISSFINGDKPAIDTLESFIAVQSREIDYQKAIQKLKNAEVSINNYLWLEGEVPLELEPNTVPSKLNAQLFSQDADMSFLIQSESIINHPELLLYDYKIDDINIDQQMAKEELKPEIRIEYNPLLAVGESTLTEEFNTNDYKLGAKISYPILQRKQRGKIELNNLKIQDIDLEKSKKTQALTVKLNTYINNINQNKSQYALIAEATDNYEKILIAENRKFEIGESSIFLINSRETKYLEMKNKRIETIQKIIYNRLNYLLTSARIQEVI